MKKLFTILRILGILFYAGLYFHLKFDFWSCFIGLSLILAITQVPKSKKSEAPTSDS